MAKPRIFISYDTKWPSERGRVVGDVIHIRRHQIGNWHCPNRPENDVDDRGRHNATEPHI